MRNIAFIASLIGCLVLPDMVSAMPVAPGATVAKAASAQIVPARGGCGARRPSRAVRRLQMEPLVTQSGIPRCQPMEFPAARAA